MFAMHQGRHITPGLLAHSTAPLTAIRGHTSLPPCKACRIGGSRAFRALKNGVRNLRNTPRAHTAVTDTATLSEVDINSRFELSSTKIDFYRNNGFVKLPRVFNEATLAHYGPSMSLEVKEADKTPYQQDPDYKQAFTQVLNLWKRNEQVFEFVKGHRLAQIAAELMGVEGVRLYADQALYKEPHGGYTPWHCDAVYWPLASDKAITAWIPLQATPEEMGPMQFLAGSQRHDLGRHLEIGRDSHKLIDANAQASGLELVSEPFQFGEVSFHSSLNFHKAEGNQTDKPREVFTIIFMDKNMRLAEANTFYHRRDRDAYFPDLQPGQLCATALNPIIWSA